MYKCGKFVTMPFQIDIKMKNMKIYGLSLINMTRASVTRGENLTDIEVDLEWAFDYILVNGTYALKGTFNWFKLDSKGFQDFDISVQNATIAYKVNAPNDFLTDRES